MKRISWGTVVALTIGAGLGIAITVLGTHGEGTERVQRDPQASHVKADNGDPQGADRLNALESQIASLRRAVNERRSDGTMGAGNPTPDAPDDEAVIDTRSPEELRRQKEQWVAGHEKNLESHRSQARDVSWAPGMEGSINEGLGALTADVKAKIEDVECRTASCAVTLSWDSEGDARSELEAISRAVGQMPCSTELGLPLDPPENGRIEIQLYMGCDRRAL